LAEAILAAGRENPVAFVLVLCVVLPPLGLIYIGINWGKLSRGARAGGILLGSPCFFFALLLGGIVLRQVFIASTGREAGAPRVVDTSVTNPDFEPPASNAVVNGRTGTYAGDRFVVQIPPGVEMAFRWCPPGSFMMGSPANEPGRGADEGPQTRVTFSNGFWISETEVSKAQWQAILGRDPYIESPPYWFPEDPVDSVSWDTIMGAQSSGRPNPQPGSIMARLGTLINHDVTLPSEAQWEYACRAGTSTQFSFGDNASLLIESAWFIQNAGRALRPVAQKAPNAWGIYDMHGNVWEWCLDWHGEYSGGSVSDYSGPRSGKSRVFRGGSWIRPAVDCRSASRSFAGPTYQNNDLGFRVVINAR
jgi:formylglycine-generating enzyme required for sulfatase activity